MCAYCLSLTLPRVTQYEPLIASTDATTATATESAAGPVPPTRPARQNSLAETVQTLEKRLAQRPDRQELEDRNILRGALVQWMPVLLRLTATVTRRWEYCSGTAGHERSVAKVPTRGTFITPQGNIDS
jgi:hypothetical protein